MNVRYSAACHLHCCRRGQSLLAMLWALLMFTAPLNAPASVPAEGVRLVVSPDGRLSFRLIESDSGLRYRVDVGSIAVIEPSRLGIVIDNVDMGRSARLEKVERFDCNDHFPTRGSRAVAVNHCQGARFWLLHAPTNTRFMLEVRAFDRGIAFRHIVPGEDTRTPDAAVEFMIPAGSTVWHHDMGGHYEGIHTQSDIGSLERGQWIAPPLTFKLPQNGGYASITEAALTNYAGMALQAGRGRVLHERLGHSHPVGSPFVLRFGRDEATRLNAPATIAGEIVTPWRVVMFGSDLNALVNSDLLESLSPPPDPALFPAGMASEWIKPGRCVWKFLDGGENTLANMFQFSQWAAQLGFEYNLIEGFWQRWTKEELQSLVDFSRERNVGIWLWKDSRDLRTPAARREFFQLCNDVGVVGVKIDFLDHEAKEVIDLYHTLLKETAEHRLMVNFHGSNKPSGEARTWPHELTREGVRGMESRRPASRARHDVTLPFTRYLAGHGDYTPVVFGERRGDTTAAHQIATAAIFTSPLLVYGGHPESLLNHQAVDMIRSIPSTWDETTVLPASEIGRIAVLARRIGNTWFLAVIGGPEALELEVPLSFLPPGAHDALLVRDSDGNPVNVLVERQEFTQSESLRIALAAGGGFIGRFIAKAPPLSAVSRPQE